MLRILVDLFYPPRCLGCGGLVPEVFCQRCRRGLLAVPAPLCARCGDPMASGAGAACRRCRAGGVPFAMSRSLALFEGPLRRAVHRLKFERRRELGPILGGLLAGFVRDTPGLNRPQVVVPIPLHPARQQERGFNQAALLAEPVAAALGVPLEPLLWRVRATAPQSDLPLPARRANVRGAFAAPSCAGGRRPARAILLVDDVLTSGATAAECARTLLEAGAAATVSVATLARARPPTRGSGAAGGGGSPATAPGARRR